MNQPNNYQGYPPVTPGFFENPTIPVNQPPNAVYLQNVVANQAATNVLLQQALQYFQSIQASNEMVKVQKEQVVCENEEAFSRIEQTSLGLVAYGKNGRPHVICPVKTESIFRVCPDNLYRQPLFYVVFFLNIEMPVFISKKTLSDPDALCDAISAGTGHVIPRFGGSKKTGQMLRSFLAANAKEIHIPFYAGWHRTQGVWKFSLLNGSTHGSTDLFNQLQSCLSAENPEIEPPPTASATLAMVQQIVRLMEVFITPELRSFLFTWIHAAFLCSLLVELKFPISQGLCLYSSDPRVLNSLKSLVCWYDDSPVSTDLSTKEFERRIIAHKDQPLTILDPAKKSKNVDVFLSAMSTGQIPTSQDESPLKMQALPTAISGHPGQFSHSSSFILVEITARDLKVNSFAMLSRLCKYLPDYLLAFAAYTSKHIDELVRELENEINFAHSNCPADCPISQEGLNSLGVLTGIQKFVCNFHKDLAPSHELLNQLRILSPSKPSALLKDALYKSSAFADSSTAIASQFCAILSRWITEGKLDVRHRNGDRINKPNQKNHGVIYIDSEAHYLTRIAFTAICEATGNSTPTILHALNDVGILDGNKTQVETFQTRKTVAGHLTAVYMLNAALVDEFSIIER